MGVEGGQRHLRVVPSDAMPEAGSTISDAPQLEVTRCSSCMAAIFFAETSSGARSPYDVYPRIRGPWRITGAAEDGTPRVMYDPSQTAGMMPPGDGYVTHWKTCPTAREHRPQAVSAAQMTLVPSPEEATDAT